MGVIKISRRRKRRGFPAMRILVAVLVGTLTQTAYPALTLEQAVNTAQRSDPWLQGSQLRQQAMEADSISAGKLPDPMVSVGFANLPAGNLNFDQEAMTQFKVGVSQVIPRGNSLAIQRRQMELKAGQQVFWQESRRAQVAAEVSALWLDAFSASESIRLMELDKSLFDQLVEVAQSGYATARGGTRQRDLIRAQLELTRLEDRLARLDERNAVARARLGEWLHRGPGAKSVRSVELSAQLPALEVLRPGLIDEAAAARVAAQLTRHPAILGLEQDIAVSEAGVELAQQNYRPQWRLNASYGYREDSPMGDNRPDFFSVGLSFDLPIFTTSRQDKRLQSAIASGEASRTDRALKLRSMMAGFEAQRSRLQGLESRRKLYRSRLLQELQDQTDASLAAYTNDDGDFAEVVRAHIDMLNARIEALHIETERLKTISQLNYFFTESSVYAREAKQ